MEKREGFSERENYEKINFRRKGRYGDRNGTG